MPNLFIARMTVTWFQTAIQRIAALAGLDLGKFISDRQAVTVSGQTRQKLLNLVGDSSV